MARYHHNLEPHGTRRGCYTGYAAGAVFLITPVAKYNPASNRNWWAQHMNGAACPVVGMYARTLADMSAKLAKIAAQMERK